MSSDSTFGHRQHPDMASKDGFIGVLPILEDGRAHIFTSIPGCTQTGPLNDLKELMEKAGFEDNDSVDIDFEDDAMKVCITIQDPDLSLRHLDRRLKAFMSCLKESGIIKNPIVSNVNPCVVRSGGSHRH